nr:hypothetical protein [Tanacetum cinerariifolium]
MPSSFSKVVTLCRHSSSLRVKAVSAVESSAPPTVVAARVCGASLNRGEEAKAPPPSRISAGPEGGLDGLGSLLEVVGPTSAELGGGEGGLGESR